MRYPAEAVRTAVTLTTTALIPVAGSPARPATGTVTCSPGDTGAPLPVVLVSMSRVGVTG